MVNSNSQHEPILPYPSRMSLTQLVVAMVERDSGVARPKDWPENESFYLSEDDATQFPGFRSAIDDAITGAEPADWLLRELQSFEQMIAEDAIANLQDAPEGQAALDAIRATAIEHFWLQRSAAGRRQMLEQRERYGKAAGG